MKMDTVELTIQMLLDGRASAQRDSLAEDIVDYSIDDQVLELASKGIDSSLKNYRPVTKKTVSYIVAAVLLNEREEVLMMQEAKSECAGTWYLPAGRVEPGEDLYSAVRREVVEETGLICDPSTLICVENAGGNWYRFVFTGSVVGGSMKTVAQADSESLQASWVLDLSSLSLRARDILPLVDKAKDYWRERAGFHKPLLPQLVSHKKLLIRTLIVIRSRENNLVHVLVANGHRLPVCEINPTRSLHAALKRFMQAIFCGQQPPEHKPHGILTVEYNGISPGERDGLCLTVLVSCRAPLEQCSVGPGYSWIGVTRQLETNILKRLNKNMTVALNVIR